MRFGRRFDLFSADLDADEKSQQSYRQCRSTQGCQVSFRDPDFSTVLCMHPFSPSSIHHIDFRGSRLLDVLR